MAIQIRAACAIDILSIIEFDEFAGDRKREVEAGTCFVAFNEDKILGYVSYEPRRLLGQPLLTFVCVRKEFRRQGIALTMVKFIQDRVNSTMLLSSTEDWCVGTQAIFERLGWKKIGEISGVNKDGSAEWFYGIKLRVELDK